MLADRGNALAQLLRVAVVFVTKWPMTLKPMDFNMTLRSLGSVPFSKVHNSMCWLTLWRLPLRAHVQRRRHEDAQICASTLWILDLSSIAQFESRIWVVSPKAITTGTMRSYTREGAYTRTQAHFVDMLYFTFYTHSSVSKESWANILRHGWHRLLFFCLLKAATQLARQVQQERTQVVCSNKVGRSRLAQRHSRNGPRTYEYWFDYTFAYCFEVDMRIRKYSNKR